MKKDKLSIFQQKERVEEKKDETYKGEFKKLFNEIAQKKFGGITKWFGNAEDKSILSTELMPREVAERLRSAVIEAITWPVDPRYKAEDDSSVMKMADVMKLEEELEKAITVRKSRQEPSQPGPFSKMERHFSPKSPEYIGGGTSFTEVHNFENDTHKVYVDLKKLEKIYQVIDDWNSEHKETQSPKF